MANEGGSDIVSHFRTGLDVLTRYPATTAPPLVAQLVMFVLTLVFIGGAVTAFALGGGAGLMGAFAGGFVLMLIGGILTLIASGVTVVMARDALAGQEPAIGPALAAVMDRFADVLVASILVMVIVGVGMMLLILPGLVALFFLIFTLPAVLLDGKNAVDALKRSAALVKDNVGPVVGLVVGWILVMVGVMIVSKILGFLPVIGQLAWAVLTGVATAYLMVVSVRVYQTLPRR